MAWNEPGGDKGDKDPWGGRNDQGPPDLDEAFKKLKSNLTELFGGKRGSGSGSDGAGNPINLPTLGLGALVLIIIWAVMGIYTVDQQEQAIVLRFGKVQEELIFPGLHWNPPIIDRVLKENVTAVRSIKHDAEMLTEDENIVKVKNLSVQYVIGDVKSYLLKVKNPEDSLHHATESAIRHVVGSTEMNDVITLGREQIAIEIFERIQRYMDDYGTGIRVTQVNIEETTYPDAVRPAVDDVIKAKEDKERLRNEADAYANRVVPEARGQAQRQLEEAEGYRQRVISQAKGEAERFNKLYKEYRLAPEVTRERLYLDTMESVMSKSTKVLIDVEGGNNLLYLPLDKLIQQGAGSNPAQQSSSTLDRLRLQEEADARSRAIRDSSSSRKERRP